VNIVSPSTPGRSTEESKHYMGTWWLQRVEIGQKTDQKVARADLRSHTVSPAPLFIVAVALVSVTPATASAQTPAPRPSETSANSRTAGPSAKAPQAPEKACQSQEPGDILVCGQRRQGYRLDPDVIEANREVETNNRSANAPSPAAQSVCSAQPMGCGKSFDSLDLANVAIVAGTIAVKAARGEKWANAFKTGGSDEYQLYQQAKRRHQAEEEERAAIGLRANARETQAEANSARAAPK
jgi:hypothetical protein